MSFTIIAGCSTNQHLDAVLVSQGKVIGLVIDSALAIIFTLGAMALYGMLVAGIGGIGSFATPVAFCLLAFAVLIVVADTITLMILMTKRRLLQQNIHDDKPHNPPRKRRSAHKSPDHKIEGLKQITDECNQWKERLTQHQQQIIKLNKTLLSQKELLERSDKELAQVAENQRNDIKNEIDIVRRQSVALALQCGDLRHKYAESEKANREAIDRNGQLEKARREKAEILASRKASSTPSVVTEKEKELKTLQQEIVQLEREHQSALEEGKKVETRTRALQLREEEFKQKLEQHEEAIKNLQMEIERGNEEIRALKMSMIPHSTQGSTSFDGEVVGKSLSRQTRKIGSLFSNMTGEEQTEIGIMKKEYLQRRDTLELQPSSRRIFVKQQRDSTHDTAPKSKTVKEKLERHTRLAIEEGKNEAKRLSVKEKFKAEVKIDLEAKVDITKVGCLKRNSIVGIAHDRGLRERDEDAFGSQALTIISAEQMTSAEIHLVCDGHGDQGYKAKFVTEVLPEQIETILSKAKELNEEVITNAITESIALIDAYLCSHPRPGGTTLTGMLYINDGAYFFNVGDSRSVLCTIEGGKVTTQQMTRDANPLNPKMARKVTKHGGKVEWLVHNPQYLFEKNEPKMVAAKTKVEKVNGVDKLLVEILVPTTVWEDPIGNAKVSHRVNKKLNMTGDLGMAGYPCQPTIGHVPLRDDSSAPQAKRKRYALIACDGLWDNLTSERAGELIAEMDAAGKTPEQMSWYLSQANLKLQRGVGGIQGAKDNLTIMVVLLP